LTTIRNSSQRFTGDLGGLAGADAICTAIAAALGGDWTAWLSDADANVRDRVIDAECRLLDRPARLRTIEVSEEQIKNAV
jgi:hypothetical protein